MNKSKEQLINELLSVNNEISSLNDKQIASVFLCEESIQTQKDYTQGMIDGLELALDTKEIESSIKSLKHLLQRRDLTFDEALDLEVAEGKSVVAIGVAPFLKLRFAKIEEKGSMENAKFIIDRDTLVN